MTKKEGTLLIVDDNRGITAALEMLLTPYFEKVIIRNSPNLIPTTLREDPAIDVALLDMNFSVGISSGGEGLYWLHQIKERAPNIAIVLFTAYADVDLAVRAIKDGASDFVQKPWDNAKLVLTLQNAMKLSRSERKVKNLEASRKDYPQMYWGHSPVMENLRRTVEKVAPTDANILILGENGTGKDMLSREIHRLSARAEGLLVGVDMGAITESLFESELFGHTKGAFTDAKIDRIGKFEAADRGTLFLDEIGNLPYHLQAKLLVALQNRAITRVGANAQIPIDIRLITATSRNLAQMVAAERFREDLLYRLNTITINLPALRQRVDDIVPLSIIFMHRYATKYGKIIDGIAPSAQDKLRAGRWAGNIRELDHTIEKAVIMSEKTELTASDFLMTDTQNPACTEPQTLEDMERQMIGRAMECSAQNLAQVAATLGITRQTLYNKIKKYGL
ncbi:MAG: sigma-54 dependent transcriptional regulator [Mucinivorans sp.]